MDAIYETYPKQHDRLLQVLIEFTKQEEPTWRAIVDALRCRTVNLPRLANIVEAAHFPNLGERGIEHSVSESYNFIMFIVIHTQLLSLRVLLLLYSHLSRYLVCLKYFIYYSYVGIPGKNILELTCIASVVESLPT